MVLIALLSLCTAGLSQTTQPGFAAANGERISRPPAELDIRIRSAAERDPLVQSIDHTSAAGAGVPRHTRVRAHECGLDMSTAEQSCQRARTRAWAAFERCAEDVIAEAYGGACFDTFKAFWRCRHNYFENWTHFQTRPSLQGSSCINSRFTDNGDGTVTDNLSSLVWEKKTDDGSVHDFDARLTMSADSSFAADGTVFTVLLATLNGEGFAGARDWRLPDIVELQTIELDFPCSGLGLNPTCICPAAPCIEPALGPTQSDGYWSNTHVAPVPDHAWGVGFDYGGPESGSRVEDHYTRAVRGGL